MHVLSRPSSRLVIVVRADPVICGHSGEARNLAEAAIRRGFDEVRIVTWPLDALDALPQKPLDSVLPYGPGIVVERPEPVGDYKVPDGRYLAGITGRLVELFTDGVPTVCLSLYLSPHTVAVTDAVRAAWSTGLPVNVTTIAEAVGSDVTNVVRSCVEQGRFGAAAHILSSYLAQDHCVAVSEYTRDLIIAAASEIDAFHGTRFAEQCREQVQRKDLRMVPLLGQFLRPHNGFLCLDGELVQSHADLQLVLVNARIICKKWARAPQPLAHKVLGRMAL